MLQTAGTDRSACTWADFPARWRTVVGPQLAHVTRPAALTYDGVLAVVASRDCLPELIELLPEILAHLPASIDGVTPRAIDLRVPRG